LFTKQVATVSGLIFTAVFFGVFEIAEKYTHRRGQVVHAEMDQFNLELGSDLTPNAVGVKPGNILVPVSSFYTLYHLESALRRAKGKQAEIVVLHVRLLRRGATSDYDLEPDQLFSPIEQMLFTKVLSIAEKEGKPVRLSVAAANDLWEGILRTASNLESSSIALGSSSKMPLTEQAREIGASWERMPEPRPRITLEIFTPSGQEQVFYLGPHAPRLTQKEIDLVHEVWLQLSDPVPGRESHHHDVIHFALDELQRQLGNGNEAEVRNRFIEHLQEIQDRRATI
jgi:Universal stress protein family